ncbi:MAG: glycosyltransferase [Planctomycetia bacterium]|nr:glycosyltransferase [Planctomycetia bacterium]
MERVRLAVVVNGTGVGGAERMVGRVLTRLSTDEFDMMVFCLDSCGAVADQLKAAGIPVLGMDILKRRVPNPIDIVTLSHELKQFRPDVVQGWMYLSNLYGGFAAKLARRDCPVAWNIRHSTLDAKIDSRAMRLTAWIGGKLSRWMPKKIVLCAEAAREAHCQVGYAPELLQVIPNGFDLGEFRPDPEARRRVRQELGLSEEVPLVGLMGRFHPHKDHRTFVQAARVVVNRVPNAHFLLVGADQVYTTSDIWSWVDEVGLRDHFHLFKVRPDPAAIDTSLDVSVCSSTTEGFPNVVGEAMACGVPCVATNVGECAEVVGDTGRIVAKRNPQQLGDAIAELLSLPRADRVALGQAARNRICERYDINRIVAQYRKLWLELAGRENAVESVPRRRAA